MPDEVQEPLTGSTAPVAAPSDWTPPTRDQWEAEVAKKAKLEADLTKHRTRAEQVEAGRKAREEAELKAKPLEEQLEAERLKREELESELSAVKLEQYNKQLDDIAEKAGVPERLIDVAANDWAKSLDDALEVAGIDPDDHDAVMEFLSENEHLDFEEWLEQENQAIYRGATDAPKLPTAPAAPMGGNKPGSVDVSKLSKEEFETLKRRSMRGEVVRLKG